MQCGHIVDYQTLVATNFVCSFDRSVVDAYELIKLKPNITKLTKVGNTWAADIVDHNREKLDDKVLYHESCGVFSKIVTFLLL
jgi:hypothetical protein